jgi:hypothetical protein
MGNGGWVAGTLAQLIADGPVQVTLRAPAPLGRPLMAVTAGPNATLWDGDVVIAQAVRGESISDAPQFVPVDAAAAAQDGFAGFHDHPFPTCFVCGPDRRPDDALRIFTGPVPDCDGEVAGTWTPTGPSADGVHVDTAAVWAALDCPTGWAHHRPGGVALLGRVTVEMSEPVRLNRPTVVIAKRGTVEGRKLAATAAIYDADGRRLAASRALWITVT